MKKQQNYILLISVLIPLTSFADSQFNNPELLFKSSQEALEYFSNSHDCIVREFKKANKEVIGCYSKESSLFVIRHNDAPEMVVNVTYQGLNDVDAFYAYFN